MAATDESTTDALDKVFNAWLAFHNILSQDGKLFKADNKGQILRDSNGNLLTIKPEQFKMIMLNPSEGLQAFAAKQGIRIKPQLRDYPSS